MGTIDSCDNSAIRIIVATHKPYWMPDDDIYLPLHVGHYGKDSFGICGDDTGDNISDKNAHYCELTGLYWAWKNLDADYMGLVHYRRHFASPGQHGDKKERVITGDELRKLLEDREVILPVVRNYYIETNYSQYVHAHHSEDLECARHILERDYPRYLNAYYTVMKRTYGHRFNMFIMKKELLDKYCTWLFDILFKMEKTLDISTYTPNDSRVFGFVGERLLDVWLEANRIAYSELPYVFMEKQNWVVKGGKFLWRKVGPHGRKPNSQISGSMQMTHMHGPL